MPSPEEVCQRAEKLLRTYMRQMNRTAVMMRSANRMSPDMVDSSREPTLLVIRRCQNIALYCAYALHSLPDDLPSRVMALQEHMDALDVLTADQFLGHRRV